MSKEERVMGDIVGLTEGARRATVGRPTTGGHCGFLKKGQRWSMSRKRDVVLRLVRGESVQALSRELGVEIYRLEQWRDKAILGMESGLRERGDDPLKKQLDAAMKRIGEITMENELLKAKVENQGPFGKRRSRK
jgi:transposase